jgi:tagatose-1,6-bisphosphate aldolase non-catalytic subunit AgaZ/GatZ
MTILSRLYAQPGAGPFTLLGVGPMSRLIVDAAIECSAREDAPLVFIASRNQVESEQLGGGYVEGWDQHDLRHYVRQQSSRHRFRAPLVLCRDHGGPWQRDEELHARLDWHGALQSALTSYRDDLDGGFGCLHVDTSRDPSYRDVVPLDLAVERVVQVVEQTEKYRLGAGREAVDYEVSLERTNGDLTPPDEFDYFVGKLVRDLESHRLPWPLFIVGNTGTLTKMGQNGGAVDFEAVGELRNVAERYGMVFKEHNADYLDADALARHPDAGIGMANVAPEFATLETDALLELCAQEESLLGPGHPRSSGLREVLLRHVRRSTRWKKWVHEVDDPEVLFHDPVWQESVIKANAHYFFRREEVRDARRHLYANAVLMGVCEDPHQLVKASVERGLLRYLEAFNLSRHRVPAAS